jgi:hypothetical protein
VIWGRGRDPEDPDCDKDTRKRRNLGHSWSLFGSSTHLAEGRSSLSLPESVCPVACCPVACWAEWTQVGRPIGAASATSDHMIAPPIRHHAAPQHSVPTSKAR